MKQELINIGNIKVIGGFDKNNINVKQKFDYLVEEMIKNSKGKKLELNIKILIESKKIHLLKINSLRYINLIINQ